MPAAYVLMPMAYIQAALSPLLKRIDLLADYYTLYPPPDEIYRWVQDDRSYTTR